MAKKERLTEDVKYTTELLRLTWASLIAVAAGTASLLLRDLPWQIVAGVGSVVIVTLGLVVWRLHRKIQARITSLEEV